MFLVVDKTQPVGDFATHKHVVNDRLLLRKSTILKDSLDTSLARLGHTPTGDLLAPHPNFTGVGPMHPGDNLNQCGFTRPIVTQ